MYQKIQTEKVFISKNYKLLSSNQCVCIKEVCIKTAHVPLLVCYESTHNLEVCLRPL